MTTAWHKPTTLGLTEKLVKLNAGLREIFPQIVEAQAEAMKRMAETVVASQCIPKEKPHE